jgi:hypothetical protein
VRNDDVVTALARYLHGDDELLREHAQWATHRLGLSVSVESERVP